MHTVLISLRIGQSLRKGCTSEIMLERFEEALHDPTARLTYSALSGMYYKNATLLLI